MCSCPKNWSWWGRAGVLQSQLRCCILLLVQTQSCNSSFPVAFPQHLPPHQPRWEHLTGGGSTQLFSQLQNVQHKNHHNSTKHSIPEPRSGKISRKAIIWADQYNSIFIPVRRCFTARRPAYTLEIIHVFHVLAVPSSCEITRQR